MPHAPLHSEEDAASSLRLQDVRLLSFWTVVASVIALAVLWRLVHTCFDFIVLAHQPFLGRLKRNDGRSPATLAGHFSTVTNAVVCLAAAVPLAQAKLTSSEWTLGAIFPLHSRPLALSPLPPGMGTFYLSLAAYCFQSALSSAERSNYGLPVLGKALLFIVVSSMCMVDSMPELAFAVLLLEVPSPFVALWQGFLDFRVRSGTLFGIAGCAAVTEILKLRLIFFGGILVCAMSHPEAGKLSGSRWLLILVCNALLIIYTVHFVQIFRDVRRYVCGKA